MTEVEHWAFNRTLETLLGPEEFAELSARALDATSKYIPGGAS